MDAVCNRRVGAARLGGVGKPFVPSRRSPATPSGLGSARHVLTACLWQPRAVRTGIVALGGRRVRRSRCPPSARELCRYRRRCVRSRPSAASRRKSWLSVRPTPRGSQAWIGDEKWNGRFPLSPRRTRRGRNERRKSDGKIRKQPPCNCSDGRVSLGLGVCLVPMGGQLPTRSGRCSDSSPFGSRRKRRGHSLFAFDTDAPDSAHASDASIARPGVESAVLRVDASPRGSLNDARERKWL